jgi:hypothetical protein
MERTYKEITLPVTGDIVQVYDYYLRGERIAIRKIMTDAVSVDTAGKAQKVDTGYTMRMENEEVRLAIKAIKRGDKKVDVTEEYINNLPEKDFMLIRENLPSNNEKNLTTRQSEDTLEKAQKNEG